MPILSCHETGIVDFSKACPCVCLATANPGWGKAMFGYVLEVVKRPELHTFRVVPKRWIVERTFGWFNWYRRLSKDYEHNPKTSEAMLHFTSCTLMLKRLAAL